MKTKIVVFLSCIGMLSIGCFGNNRMITDNKVWHIDYGYACPQTETCFCYLDLKTTIYDVHGRKLQTLYPDSDNYETDISILPCGLYIIAGMNVHIKFLIK